MKIIGITGSFGTGKTYVASIFRSLGAKIIDADRIAHEAIKKGSPAYKRIVSAFGKEILSKDGNVARAVLAEKVFGDKRNLRRINKIVHPYVIRSIRQKIKKVGRDEIIVIDAPLLVEANLTGLVDALVVVKSSRKSQIERCSKKFCIYKKDVLKRIDSQISLEKKLRLADFVIDNSGARSETKIQVRKVWRQIIWK